MENKKTLSLGHPSYKSHTHMAQSFPASRSLDKRLLSDDCRIKYYHNFSVLFVYHSYMHNHAGSRAVVAGEVVLLVKFIWFPIYCECVLSVYHYRPGLFVVFFLGWVGCVGVCFWGGVCVLLACKTGLFWFNAGRMPFLTSQKLQG